MDVKKRIKRSFKLRFAILYPFGLLAVFFSHPSDKLFLISAGLIILGLLIRVWSNGYAIKMDSLTTSGPYAYVRNPLYSGTILIVMGFAFMFDSVYLGLALVLVTLFVYINTISKEEKMLEAKFKDSYLDYKSKVPALFFTPLPYKQGEKWGFSMKRLIDSKEYKPFIWVIVLLIIVYIKNEILARHRLMDARLWSFACLAVLLGMVDIISEVKKSRDRAAGNNR